MITDTYRELNQELHQVNQDFGNRGNQWLPQILKLANKGKVRSILDYGCGKGRLAQTLQEKKFEVHQYDPAVKKWNNFPEFGSDMVVCVDVLEHIESEFIEITLDKLRELSLKAFFAVIALRPSNKVFSDGRNTHVTLHTHKEWMELLTARFQGGKRLYWRNEYKLLFEWSKLC